MDILVIDDNAQVRKMLSSYLIKNGHVVEMANDGKQGWDMIERVKGQFDLIFTDIKMPVMNGLELLERIRANNMDIPVIIMTGYAVIELTLKAFKLGAYDFLTKPFEFKPLLATLDKIETIKASKQEMVNISEHYRAIVEFSLPSKTRYIKSLIPILHRHFKSLCELHKQDSHTISSCLFEAVKNAIVYGNLGLSPELKEQSIDHFNDQIIEREATSFGNKQVHIRAELNADYLKFEVEDQGKGFDTAALPQYNENMKSLPVERGLFLIRSNMDEVSWNQKGNCITMIKRFRH
jgi:CheY-like chemotaxis protein/anti-sigma regulatory factor (Ser/Thr protein kinase)